MTDNEPDEDEEQTLEEAIEQAQKAHQFMDIFKEWAAGKPAEYRERARMMREHDIDGENEPEEYEDAADLIESVYQRIERGDANT